MTKIGQYAELVCKKLGRQYSLYADRAIELLPEAIRQVVKAETYEANELYPKFDDNGTFIKDIEINIPAQFDYSFAFTHDRSDIIIIYNKLINVRGKGCLVSRIEPNQYPVVQYWRFTQKVNLVTYYMEYNTILFQNLTNPLQDLQVVASYRQTRFELEIIRDQNTALEDFFSHNVVLDIINAGAELLKSEIEL